jgi:hypothetical protein
MTRGVLFNQLVYRVKVLFQSGHCDSSGAAFSSLGQSYNLRGPLLNKLGVNRYLFFWGTGQPQSGFLPEFLDRVKGGPWD